MSKTKNIKEEKSRNTQEKLNDAVRSFPGDNRNQEP